MSTTRNNGSDGGSNFSLPLFLCELLGLTEFLLVAEACCIEDGIWTICVTPRFVCLECPKCASRNVKLLQATYPCDVTNVPVGAKRTRLRVLVPRIHCRQCRKISSPEIPRTLPHHHVTVDLVDYMLTRFECRQTYTQIALDCGFSEKTVARILKEVIREIDDARKKALVLPTKVGVDDIHIWRGDADILTHFVDVGSGQTLDLVKGTSGEDIQFWLGGARDVSAVENYSSDGADQYIAAGRRNFPEAKRTLDKYHAVTYMLEGLDSVRTATLGHLGTNKSPQKKHLDEGALEAEEDA